MTAARLPLSVVSSVALHAGLVLLYLQSVQMGKKDAGRVIGDVDLMIQVRKAAVSAVPRAAAAPPPTMMSFLKLALPTVERTVPRALDVKVAERPTAAPIAPEKLVDQRPREIAKAIKLDDAGARSVKALGLDAALESGRRSVLAQAPRLEEVGTSRVRNLEKAVALEDQRREAAALARLEAAMPDSGRRVAAMAAPVLREANPFERGRLGDRMEELRPAAGPAPMAAPPVQRRVAAPEPLSAAPRAVPAPAATEKKKAVELEGPVSNRKVLKAGAPEYPERVRSLGLPELAVAVRFRVSPEGAVLPDMKIERSSGLRELDKASMDCLREWLFAPISTQEIQWGIVTFRFVLEQ